MRHRIESLDAVAPDSGTVLVFGGVTLQGFEKARKLTVHWTSLDRGVVWFDGFSGDKPANPQTDGLLVIDYAERERNRRLNRLERNRAMTISSDLPTPETDARTEPSSTPVATTTLTHNADRFLARLVKRWNTATRGYVSWRLIRGEVLALADRLTPAEIVFCDDHALTAAWHAARIWPETPVTRAPTS